MSLNTNFGAACLVFLAQLSSGTHSPALHSTVKAVRGAMSVRYTSLYQVQDNGAPADQPGAQETHNGKRKRKISTLFQAAAAARSSLPQQGQAAEAAVGRQLIPYQ